MRQTAPKGGIHPRHHGEIGRRHGAVKARNGAVRRRIADAPPPRGRALPVAPDRRPLAEEGADAFLPGVEDADCAGEKYMFLE